MQFLCPYVPALVITAVRLINFGPTVHLLFVTHNEQQRQNIWNFFYANWRNNSYFHSIIIVPLKKRDPSEPYIPPPKKKCRPYIVLVIIVCVGTNGKLVRHWITVTLTDFANLKFPCVYYIDCKFHFLVQFRSNFYQSFSLMFLLSWGLISLFRNAMEEGRHVPFSYCCTSDLLCSFIELWYIELWYIITVTLQLLTSQRCLRFVEFNDHFFVV